MVRTRWYLNLEVLRDFVTIFHALDEVLSKPTEETFSNQKECLKMILYTLRRFVIQDLRKIMQYCLWFVWPLFTKTWNVFRASER